MSSVFLVWKPGVQSFGRPASATPPFLDLENKECFLFSTYPQIVPVLLFPV